MLPSLPSLSFAIRKAAAAERDRLRDIYRDAVRVAGPQRYTASRVAGWMTSADDVDAWDQWLREGSTWVAVETRDPQCAIGVALMWPADQVHLLYVDPAFHRRGIASALLAAVEPEARDRGITSLTTDASLISHPVFVGQGYQVVEWEEVERRGEVFRRARMRKDLR